MKKAPGRALTMLLAVILLMGCAVLPAAAAVSNYTVTVSDGTEGTATVSAGDSVTIRITVMGDAFNGLQGTFRYDSALFELKSISGAAAADDPKTAEIELYLLSDAAYPEGTEIFTASFQAISAGTGTFSVDSITVGDYEDFRRGDALFAATVNDRVTVKSSGSGGDEESEGGVGSEIIVTPLDPGFRGSAEGKLLPDGSIEITVRDESGKILPSVPCGVRVTVTGVQEGQVVVVLDENGMVIDLVEKSLVENHVAYTLLPGTCRIKIVENRKFFLDVKDSAWFIGAVAFTSSHELFRGVSETEFAPELPMTRAMMVTVIYRLENEPKTSGVIPFDDVKEGTWYTDAVIWAFENGIVYGTGNGFEPDVSVTREQMATLLYRYMHFLEFDTGERGDLSRFSDGSKVSSWAADAMAWAVGVGLFRGDDLGCLNPRDDATRAEVATLMERLVTMMVKPKQ